MGILNWLRKPAPEEALAPATSAAQTLATPELPTPPVVGRVDSFHAEDGVGGIVLEDGTELRFGRSACRGFEPALGLRVRVDKLRWHARLGLRATAVSCEEGDSRPGLSVVRDSPMAFAEAVETAAHMAWVVVLLTVPVPDSSASLADFERALGLQKRGVRVERRAGTGALRFHIDGHSFESQGFANQPYPAERMDTRHVDTLPVSQSFLGLSMGMASQARDMRLIALHQGEDYDPWGELGSMRALSKLVRILLKKGAAVVLTQADELAVEAKTFIARLGDLEDPACRPYAAWLDVTLVESLFDEDEPAYLRSHGMGLSGFLDVAVSLSDSSDAWELERAREAVYGACHAMVRFKKEVPDDGYLDVAVGAHISAYAQDHRGHRIRYAASERQPFLWLERSGPLPFESSVRRAVPALHDYYADFWRKWEAVHPSLPLESIPSDPAAPVPHQVWTRRSLQGDGVFLMTTGLGRVIQPGSSAGSLNQRVELLAWTQSDDPRLTRLLFQMAGIFHDHEPRAEEAWAPSDILPFSEPGDWGGITAFLLAYAGQVELPSGDKVTVLSPIPLFSQEAELGEASAIQAALQEAHGSELLAPWIGERWQRLLGS